MTVFDITVEIEGVDDGSSEELRKAFETYFKGRKIYEFTIQNVD